MCGRYTLTASPQVVQATFNLAETPDLSPRYNVAPTQMVPIITGEARDKLTWVKWGLVPPWSKDESGASKLINARGETVDEKPSFRSAFKKRRCLIPADGFYEWRKEGDKKKPQFIYLGDEKDRQLFAFAGLWETWHSPTDETVYTCTIITGEPNDLVKPMHHRMAVILPPEDYSNWLDEDTPAHILKSMITTPYPPETMHTYEVSTLVNNARVDEPGLLEPNTPPQQTLLM
jgi:putative SOS response-associated peptidase YedK